MRKLTFDVSEEFYNQLQEYADAKNMSLEDAIWEQMREKLASKPSFENAGYYAMHEEIKKMLFQLSVYEAHEAQKDIESSL
jgi:hypothetical protein